MSPNTWEAGKVNCFELSDLIHEFHDNSARELYKLYVMFTDDRTRVRGALERGVLSERELPADVLEYVKKEKKA